MGCQWGPGSGPKVLGAVALLSTTRTDRRPSMEQHNDDALEPRVQSRGPRCFGTWGHDRAQRPACCFSHCCEHVFLLERQTWACDRHFLKKG